MDMVGAIFGLALGFTCGICLLAAVAAVICSLFNW